MDPANVTLGVLAIGTFLFITEIIPLAVTALGMCTALGLLGCIPVDQIYAGLSNSAIVFFGSMFIIGLSTFESGLIRHLGIWVLHRLQPKQEMSLMACAMGYTIFISSVSSNTGTVACLMPILIPLCEEWRISISRVLMSLAVAANVGGSITMIGTPPNVVTAGVLAAVGMESFGFFESAWIGIPLSIILALYLILFGRKRIEDMDPFWLDEIEPEEKVEIPFDGNQVWKMWVSGGILVTVLVLIAWDSPWFPPQLAAVSGAILCVMTGCLHERELYSGFDWVTVFLMAAMMAVAVAVYQTGAGEKLAGWILYFFGNHPAPLLVMIALFVVANIATQFISNTVCASLLAPIGLSLALALSCNQKPFLMAVGVATSMAFATPMATPPNYLVFGPGGLSFDDYVRVGIPLCIISCLVSIVLIPWIWPF